jgi:hypothetical protein
VSILDLIDEEPAPAKKTAKKPSKKGASKWGTDEEHYRRLCMLVLLCRHTYYYHATSIVEDHEYDLVEDTLFKVEDKRRDLIHSKSPTFNVGSDREEDYPLSVRRIWEMHKDDPKLFVFIGKAVMSFRREIAKRFEVE